MERIRDKCHILNLKYIIATANVLMVFVLIAWYALEHSSPYKDNLATIFVKYFRPDHCIITPWSEHEYNVHSWRNNNEFMDVCLLPEFIEKNKVTLYGLSQFLQIQYNDKTSPVYRKPFISSRAFSTNFNSVLLDGTKILHHPKEIYTNTTATIDCVNQGFDNSVKKFRTRRPFKVSFMTTNFQHEEMDFYGASACFLADYFSHDTT